jgi:serine phosphatase RsbU (regulator of sigma subunit)/ligand-binding sensor domain-containing protein
MLSFIAAIGQNVHENGLFDVRNYSSKEYNWVSQNFAIVQDQRGVLYFGNNSGILEYDGAKWNQIISPKESAVHSLAINGKGTIFVGGTGEIGYLAPDAIGKIRYHSLLTYLDPKDQNFAEVWKCFATRDGLVYFQASNKIFCWNGHAMKTWSSSSSFHLMFYLNNAIYVREREVGLKKIIGGNLVLIQGGELFAEPKIYFMLPFLKNQILLNTQKHGLFVMTPGKETNSLKDLKDVNQLTKVGPFRTQIDEFLKENLVYNCIPINNHEFSIGTLGSGLASIDTAGNLTKALAKNTGLQDGVIQGQFLDAQQKLWLATNNGICKVDINSPVTRFNDQNGLEGMVLAVTRFQGKLYVATASGVFFMEEQHVNVATGSLEQAHFTRLSGISSECWDLLRFTNPEKNMMLIASNNGVFQFKDGKTSLIFDGNASVLHPSKKDSSRVFVGLTDGLVSIYWKNGKWLNEGRVNGITEYVRCIDEDEKGNLWIGNNGSGVARVDFKTGNPSLNESVISRYDTLNGLPNEKMYVKCIAGHVYFASSQGLFQYLNKRFIPDSSLGSQFTGGRTGVFRIDEDQKGNIWMVTILKKGGQEICFRNRSEKSRSSWIRTPFMGISKSNTLSVFHDPDGIAWLGGFDGLFRFDGNIEKNYDQKYFSLVRKVILGKDSVLFGGAYFNDSGFVSLDQPEKLKPSLHYSYNSLTFQFAAPNFEDESATQYSSFLEGFDKQWSNWKNETKAVYTNLPEGDYHFRVKARNVFGRESQEAVYAFTVLAPWYRTVWAYLGYVLFFIGFVLGAIVVSTRGLRNIINERTAEVVKQKEVIELKNKDITDSINYAKRIQEAILPTRENFSSLFPESFILFKPKDIVSGDFYWLSEKNGKAYIAAADCTGHGVPGAFTSMIGNALLNEIVNDRLIAEPGKILDALREGIIKALKQTGKEGESKDGMDISLCCVDLKTKELQFAGAYNPLYLVRNNELTEIKSDKFPIGISDNLRPFTNHKIGLHTGDTLYIFSDGYADQFGGPGGKKYMRKRLKELFLGFQHLPMQEQWALIDKSLVDWQGGAEQVDDILVIGIRI